MSDAEEKAPQEEEGMEVDAADSDSDSSDGEEDALEKRAVELESQIGNYAYSYDAHVELVGIYKKLLNLKKMRESYERFHQHFPLTAQLWLDWIRDEMRVANTENEKKYIFDLFNKAVEDYLSVDLWLEYVQFSIGQSNLEEARKIFERAVSAAGLHVAKGSLIWDALREFELAHLSLISDSDSEEWLQQAQRVNEIFRRQLSVPLLDMDRTYVEWRVWVERLPKQDFIKKEQVEYVYKKAADHLEDCRSFEEDLLEARSDADKLKFYREYIRDERKPEHIRCLYERAIAEVSLDGEIWHEYCIYYFDLGNYPTALSTSERALRNCPWDSDLWVFNLRILELNEKSHDDITACLEKALQVGFQTGQQYLQIWLTYLEHYRRITDPKNKDAVEKLRDAFQKGYKHIADNFGIEGDPDCSLLRLWAKIEASFLNDITSARKIWNDYGILKTLGNTANTWLELIHLEQQYGDDKHVRKTYHRALTCTKDWPQCIVQAWLIYERQFGTVESCISTTNTCQKFMKKYSLENPVQQQQYDQSLNGNKPEPDKQGKKRKIHEQKNHSKETEKKMKQVRISDESTKKISNENEDSQEEVKKDKPRIEMDPDKQQRSVFISNLDYGVTEEQLREFLGPVDELRLVKDRKGHSKGYAYCVFAEKEEAKKTLKRDRELLTGRPVFISECKTDRMQREPQFKYPTEQEKHKLFVRGLPLTMSQEEVEDLFKQHGDVKEVRLVTYRNGRSKGLAYVEFVNSNDAAKAIIATDNTEVRGFTIAVAISDPPKRKVENNDTPAPEHTRNSKTRIQIPLVPRIIQTNPAKPAQPTMSNDDFRKLFNKQ